MYTIQYLDIITRLSASYIFAIHLRAWHFYQRKINLRHELYYTVQNKKKPLFKLHLSTIMAMTVCRAFFKTYYLKVLMIFRAFVHLLHETFVCFKKVHTVTFYDIGLKKLFILTATECLHNSEKTSVCFICRCRVFSHLLHIDKRITA